MLTPLQVHPQPLTPDFISNRSERITPAASARVAAALRQLGLVDGAGAFTDDPRYTKLPWRGQLAELVPEVAAAPDPAHVSGGWVGDEAIGWQGGRFARSLAGRPAGTASRHWIPRSKLNCCPCCAPAAWRKPCRAPQCAVTHRPPMFACLPAEELNRAFASHEIVGDHLTACLAWLEARGTAPLAGLSLQFGEVALPGGATAGPGPHPPAYAAHEAARRSRSCGAPAAAVAGGFLFLTLLLFIILALCIVCASNQGERLRPWLAAGAAARHAAGRP